MRWQRPLVWLLALGSVAAVVAWLLHPLPPVSTPVRTFLPLLHLLLLKPEYWVFASLQTVALGFIAAGVLLAATLALVLASRGGEDPLRLGLFLAGTAFFVAHVHFARAGQLLDAFGAAATALDYLATTALLAGFWHGVRFFLSYPRRVDSALLGEYAQRSRLPGLRWLAYHDGVGPTTGGTQFVMHRASRALDAFGSRTGLVIALVAGWFWVAVFHAVAPRPLWSMLSVLALLSLGALMALAAGWIWELLGWHYRMGPAEDRAKVSWIFLSILVSGWIIVVGFAAAWLIGLVGFAFGQADLGVTSVRLAGLIAAFGPLALALLFVASLALSVFYKGTVDPRLAIRRTTLLGTTALLLTTLAVALEVFVASRLAAWLPLPAHTGSLCAGVTVALCFGPMRRRYESKIDQFIDRLLPASALADAEHYPTTVVFADLAGYTALSERDEKAALTLASLLHKESRRLADQQRGRLVKTIGDAGLYEFKAAADALAFCIELNRQYRASAAKLGLEVLPLHFGAHFGEVVRAKDGDLFGATVNLAARLQSKAEGNEIIVSDAVALTLPDRAFRLDPLGPQTFKNVQEPVLCFRVAA
ncbi:MAG: hypothetical protein JSR48_14810 [Verrucomicrobia bacterium]|nr:hypothetical protein [Verrucomicrobiota bacterium]